VVSILFVEGPREAAIKDHERRRLKTSPYHLSLSASSLLAFTPLHPYAAVVLSGNLQSEQRIRHAREEEVYSANGTSRPLLQVVV
jgi:hypothetical protein